MRLDPEVSLPDGRPVSAVPVEALSAALPEIALEVHPVPEDSEAHPAAAEPREAPAPAAAAQGVFPENNLCKHGRFSSFRVFD